MSVTTGFVSTLTVPQAVRYPAGMQWIPFVGHTRIVGTASGGHVSADFLLNGLTPRGVYVVIGSVRAQVDAAAGNAGTVNYSLASISGGPHWENLREEGGSAQLSLGMSSTDRNSQRAGNAQDEFRPFIHPLILGRWVGDPDLTTAESLTVGWNNNIDLAVYQGRVGGIYSPHPIMPHSSFFRSICGI